jgi:hypothetical protein
LNVGEQPRIRIGQKDLLEAVEVDFTEEKEYWNVYQLEDGTTLKVKLVLRGVKRLRKHNPDGTPIYLINSQNIIRAVNIPVDLKVKPKPSTFEPV